MSMQEESSRMKDISEADGMSCSWSCSLGDQGYTEDMGVSKNQGPNVNPNQ